MSLFQSGPYQSKVFSYTVRQTRRWADRVGVSLRQLKDIASWSAQILLYPAYVLLQTARLAGNRLRQAVKIGVPKLRFVSATRSTPAKAKTAALTADTPVQQVLQTIQTLSLSIGSIQLEQVLPEPIGRLSTTLNRKLVARPQSVPSPDLSQPVRSTGSPIVIRGVASLLEARTLVLVTPENQILDILTVEQQKQVRQRIAWEVAHYGRYLKLGRSMAATVRLQKSQLQKELQLSGGERLTPRPSALQRIGAVLRQGWQIAGAGLAAVGRIAGQLDRPMLSPATPPTADTPLQQVLQTAQGFVLPVQWSSLLVQGKLVPHNHQALALHSDHSNMGSSICTAQAQGLQPDERLMESIKQPLGNGVSESAHTSVSIQGVATVLETRSLVLVTNQNQVLDILTPDQQHRLRQRIIWEVASYGRYLCMQQATRWVARLRPPTAERPILPPIRAFQSLMVWVQNSPVAIAANLFQEASLVAASELATASTGTIATATTTSFAGSVASFMPDASPLIPVPSTNTAPQHSPDYIDTQVTLLGYVQTPLESFLRWLDAVALWVEERLLALWREFIRRE